MNASETIRLAVARVAALRLETEASAPLRAATTAVKRFQSQRFSATYRDLLEAPEYGAAARFFLVELYSEKDYSQRDAQFARIAGALQRLFPQQVVATAVALAELHQLSEELDHAMARVWMEFAKGTEDPLARYVSCWTTLGRSEDRFRQLDLVLTIGKELDRLTRTPGLRMMLRMMRRPAKATGLEALQNFLEAGFDTFAELAAHGGAHAQEFLNTIAQREAELMNQLFAKDVTVRARALQRQFSDASPLT